MTKSKKKATNLSKTTRLMEQLADGRWAINGEAVFDTQDEARDYMIDKLNEGGRELGFQIVKLPDGRFITAPLLSDGTPDLSMLRGKL